MHWLLSAGRWIAGSILQRQSWQCLEGRATSFRTVIYIGIDREFLGFGTQVDRVGISVDGRLVMQRYIAQGMTPKSLGAVCKASDCTGGIEKGKDTNDDGNGNVEMIGESHIKVWWVTQAFTGYGRHFLGQ